MTVPISLTAPQFNSRIDPVLEAAQVAEDVGFSGLFFFDHLVPLDDVRRPIVELAATIGAVAAVTRRLTVGSLVMRAPLRGSEVSVALARTVAAVAPGRTVIGLGAGDRQSAEEAERFGTPVATLSERVETLAETVAGLVDAGITTWVGGLHPRVRDVAMKADGWNAWAIDAHALAPMASQMTAVSPHLTVTWGGSVVLGADSSDLDSVLAARQGRGGTITGTPEQVRTQLGGLVEAGVRHLVLSVLPNRRERWELFAETVGTDLPG